MTPVQTLMIIENPEPITLSVPETTELVRQYNEEILPLATYRIETAEQYVQANKLWDQAKNFCKSVEKLFKDEKQKRFAAHRQITTIESQMLAPGKLISDHFGNEIIRYNNEQERKRREEEARRQREEEAKARAEQARLQAIADAERAAAEAAAADKDPWDDDVPVIPEPVKIELQAPAPVRLQSTVPQAIGGPRMVDKPWACKIVDPVALLTWVLEKPDERLVYVEFSTVELNRKCRELGADTGRIIPGVEAVREQTLKRS